MESRSVEAIVTALREHRVRYLIVGGLAVVAHGVVRFTADLDIVLDMAKENLERAIDALESLHYRPRAPVPFRNFANVTQREAWIRERGLTVFSVYSADHAATEVDLFVRAPFDFDAAYERAMLRAVAPGVEANFVSLDDLVDLKRQAGRPQDLEDIRRLRELTEEST